MPPHAHDWQEYDRREGSRPGKWIVVYKCGICGQVKTETEG